MRHLALIAVAPLLALACGTPPCQELGQRICSCSGIGEEACKTQVEDQLNNVDPGDETCERYLATCGSENAGGADFCEWLGTEAGKQACGIAQPPAP